jgi:hypothetical protein
MKSRLASFFAADELPGLCVAQTAPTHACVGCPSETEVDESVLAAAQWSVASVNRARNSPHPLEMVRVRKASKQVVAGIKFTLVLEVAESDCANDGEEHVLSACPVRADAQLQLLTIEVRAGPPQPAARVHAPRALPHTHPPSRPSNP